MKKALQIRDKHIASFPMRFLKRARRLRRTRKNKNTGLEYASHRYELTIRCPFALNLWGKNNRRHTLSFIADLRRAIIDQNRPVVIDFKELQFAAAHAMLLFIAELDRAKRIMGADFRLKLLPSDTPRMNSVLEQVGLVDLCGGVLDGQKSESDETVKHWRYATGERINETTEEAFMKVEGALAPPLVAGLWRGVSEALGNSTEHAYLEPRGTDSRRLATKRWWMFSQLRDNRLSVVVADLGIGIPRSLPLKWPRGTIAKLVGSFLGDGDDVRAIRAAMQVGASSTAKSNRGRGLPQIRNEMKDIEGASVSIFSNKGILIWNGEKKEEQFKERKDSIFGTVIAWSIPTSELSDE